MLFPNLELAFFVLGILLQSLSCFSLIWLMYQLGPPQFLAETELQAFLLLYFRGGGYYVYLFISWNWGNSYKLALTYIIVQAWWMLLQVHVVYKPKSPFDLREFYHKVISIPAMELPTSSSATVSAGASCGLCQGKLLSRALISLGKCVLHGLISEHYFCIVSKNFLMHKWKKSGFSSSLAWDLGLKLCLSIIWQNHLHWSIFSHLLNLCWGCLLLPSSILWPLHQHTLGEEG